MVDGCQSAAPISRARPEREFSFTDEQFEYLRARVSELTGIHLTEAKRELVYGRVSRRLRVLRLNSFSAYCELLGKPGSEELEQFVNAITTNLTSFFREAHHFDYLAEKALPQRLARQQSSRRLRIWSAGCSTGEEPYSIAITLKESLGSLTGWDARILATDLDSNVLARARRGIYSAESVQKIPGKGTGRWFRRAPDAGDNAWEVLPEIRELIVFKQLNLMGDWPMRGKFDVIFCRNVVIYFDKSTQKVLFERFGNILEDEGFLFLGHSESLFQVTDRFRHIGKSTYRKEA